MLFRDPTVHALINSRHGGDLFQEITVPVCRNSLITGLFLGVYCIRFAKLPHALIIRTRLTTCISGIRSGMKRIMQLVTDEAAAVVCILAGDIELAERP